jgi:hypothetical protein
MSEKLELQTNQKSIITVEVEESLLTGVVTINIDDVEILVKATPVFNVLLWQSKHVYEREEVEVNVDVTVTEQKKTTLTN